MPVVTINPDHYDRAELKSAPKDPTIEGDEDGYIMLRPLPYGEKQKIRDRSTKMFMRSVTQKRQKGKMRAVHLRMMQLWNLRPQLNCRIISHFHTASESIIY
jgi:hypothetical protein